MKTKHILIIVALLLATGIYGQSTSPQGAIATRNLSRGVSTEIDASYYNPAGTVMLSEGFHFSLSNQSVFQKNIIESTFMPYKGNVLDDGTDYKKFEGKTTRSIMPSLQVVYKKGKWALSGNLAFTGGGKVTFKNGLSMFEASVSALPNVLTTSFPAGLMTANKYQVEQYMTGTNFIFGAQVGGAYQINEMFSVYVGVRLNVVNNKHDGYLRNLKVNLISPGVSGLFPAYDGRIQSPEAPLDVMVMQLGQIENPSQEVLTNIKALELLKLTTTTEGAKLNSKQAGWGVVPVLGVHFSYNRLNVGAKYTFRTKIDLKNTTNQDDFGLFTDGETVRGDIPALFSLGASYQFTPKLNVSISYLHLFQSSAKRVANKNEFISGSNEFAVGAEYAINQRFLVSLSGALAKHDVKKEYQSDLDFLLDSYSIGLGGAMNITEKLQANIGFSWTHYSKDRVSLDNSFSNEYAKKSKSFSVGLSYSF